MDKFLFSMWIIFRILVLYVFEKELSSATKGILKRFNQQLFDVLIQMEKKFY
jgi:hypothetical protein